MKNSNDRKPLLVPCIVFTLSIIFLSITSYYLITSSTDVFLHNSTLTKLTGKQRMLSQQIINSLAADNLEGKLEGPPLMTMLKNFTQSQKLLAEQKGYVNNDANKDRIILKEQFLETSFYKLLNTISINISNDKKHNFLDLLAAEDMYLKQLDKLTEDLNGFSNLEVQKFKQKGIIVLSSSLLLLLLEIVWLFRPALKQMSKQNKMLNEMTGELQNSYKSLEIYVKEIESKNESLQKIADMQAHEIRHPLTCITGLLNLIKDIHYVIDDEWLQMMSEAAKNLDTKIKSIIAETNASKNLKVIRFNKIVDEIEDYAILLLDKNGHIENWNRGAENLKGYHANEIIGKHFSIFYSGEDKKRNRPKHFLEEAKAYGFAKDEAWRIRKDGSRFWGSILMTAIHDDNSEVIGFTNVTRDPKEQKNSDHSETRKAG